MDTKTNLGFTQKIAPAESKNRCPDFSEQRVICFYVHFTSNVRSAGGS